MTSTRGVLLRSADRPTSSISTLSRQALHQAPAQLLLVVLQVGLLHIVLRTQRLGHLCRGALSQACSSACQRITLLFGIGNRWVSVSADQSHAQFLASRCAWSC
jgi:hypothetical protein